MLILNENSDYRKKVRTLGKLFDEILDSLLSSEFQSFQSMLAKILFFVDKYNVVNNTAAKLRKLYIYISKTNRNKSIIPAELEINGIVNVISSFIFYCSDIPIIDELKNLNDHYIFEGTDEDIKEDNSEYLQIIVKNVTPVINKSAPAYVELLCYSTNDNTELKIRIEKNNNNYNDEYFNYLCKLKKYCKITFYNFSEIDYKQKLYKCNLDSYFVIEPDFLIDVSDISGCFTMQGANYKIYFLDKFIGSTSSEGTLRGSLVNSLLDIRLKEPELSFDELFLLAIENNLLKISKFNNEIIEKIKNEIAIKHFPQIVKFTNGLLKLKDENNNIKITIEPTFYSEQHGLQGRLDVLIEYTDEPLKKEIVELKSGSPPSNGVWTNDMMQAVGYDLMLQSVFGKDRKGSNNILYSASYNKTYRNVIRNANYEVEFCKVRNLIICEILNQADGNFNLLSNISVNAFGVYPKYLLENIRKFENAFISNNNLENKYFTTYVKYIWNELLAVKLGIKQENKQNRAGFCALWNDSLDEKIENNTILPYLVFDKYENEKKEYTFKYNGETSNFRDNDIGIIYKYPADNSNPLKQQIYKCAIKKVTSNEVKISLRNNQLNNNIFNDADMYFIEHDLFDNNYYSNFKSLFSFILKDKKIKNELLGVCNTASKNKHTQNMDGNILSYVKKAAMAERYFLLQGPPGTGKTSSFLMKYLDEILADKNTRVLIITFTNKALEEIIRHLKNRVYSFTLFSSSSDEKYSFKTQLKQNFNTGFKFNESQICLTTSLSYLLYSEEINFHFKITTVIVDEASQILEPQIIGILSNFEKFVLIGDQNQLPAISVQDEKFCNITDENLNKLFIKQLTDSYFERLFRICNNNNWFEHIDTLKIHYRMHYSIAELINDYYDKKLVCGKKGQSDETNLFENSICLDNKNLVKTRVVFFDVDFSGNRFNKYCKNEADLIKLLIDKISNNIIDFNENSIGIITPWRAQISLIKNILSDNKLLNKIQVDTVERYQGSEKDIIIVSFAVSHYWQLKNLSSFDSAGLIDRKLNVALSRAKEYLFLIGNSKILTQTPHFSVFIEKIKNENTFVNSHITTKMLSIQ
ncbi:MAG: AAA domain-containing protein [bacterium]